MARQINMKRLFVKPVDPSVAHETIKNYFSQYGDVIDANNIKNYTAFVYCSSNEARQIIKRTNGTHFRGRKLTVELARVQGKNTLGFITAEKRGICYGFNYPIYYPDYCTNPRCPNRHICLRCFDVMDEELEHAANESTCPSQTENFTPYRILHERDVIARSEISENPTEMSQAASETSSIVLPDGKEEQQEVQIPSLEVQQTQASRPDHKSSHHHQDKSGKSGSGDMMASSPLDEQSVGTSVPGGVAALKNNIDQRMHSNG